MIPTDIGNEIHFHRAISPHNDDGAGENGAAVDRQGYQSCLLALDVGATEGTPDSFTVDCLLQESEDGSTSWAQVDDSALTQITAINTSQVRAINLAKCKRYIRAVAAVEFVNGTTPKVLLSGALILGGPDTLPAV